MIGTEHLQTIVGSHAVDNDGDKLGKIGNVYLDDRTGEPAWVTVNTGLFGTKESFVPLRTPASRATLCRALRQGQGQGRTEGGRRRPHR